MRHTVPIKDKRSSVRIMGGPTCRHAHDRLLIAAAIVITALFIAWQPRACEARLARHGE